MKLIGSMDQKLLDRKVVRLEIEDSGSTPTNEEVRKKVAEIVKSEEDLIAVKKIHSEYGGGKFSILAHVYDNKESLTRMEKFNKKSKDKKDGGQEAGKEQESK